MTSALVLPLDDPAAELDLVGGKGASLARLAVAGLPVPTGFHVTTDAYRLVTGGGPEHEILGALEGLDMEDDAAVERASDRIRKVFAGLDVPAEVADAIRAAYADMAEPAVAVRSSATAEDLPGMSFAGQQDTYLNIRGEQALLAAVKDCWASLWNARALAYRARNGVPSKDVALAVVVQELVPAEAAGVLFTANPLSGARDELVVNAAWGLGETVVGGQVTPDTYVVERAGGGVIERRIGDKTVMTVRTDGGTRDEAVPEDRRAVAVLDDGQVAELARIGVRIEELYGTPMDVEWAALDGQFAIVQARPITNLRDAADAYEKWNDSLDGDYLWTSGNLGEAIPDVMTPVTWSLVQRFMAGAMASSSLPELRAYGNIGGRFYMNLSLSATIAEAFGAGRKFREASEPAFGKLPAGVEIPLVPIPRKQVMKALLPTVFGGMRRVVRNAKLMPAFLAGSPGRSEGLRLRIKAAPTAAELDVLWAADAEPYFDTACHMLEAARRDAGAMLTVRKKLTELVGEAAAETMLTGQGAADGGELVSLGPLVGLGRIARGELTREAYVRQWGHRGPHEFEVARARPAEDPEWIDRQLAGLREADRDPVELLARQEAASAEAWERFARERPGKVKAARKAVAQFTAAAHGREATRSEVIRAFWVAREFVLRAGELTGHGDAVFFLSLAELRAVLGGDEAPLERVAARRAAHAHYSGLPPYPTLIRGRFDPDRWAADPDRRADLYDAHGASEAAEAITGFPGAPGVVEAVARVAPTVEDAGELRAGEILVTTVTNIGWTPLFPRAAAVVTDVGAPLSHAAIVARELGIPAVVGCGNATMRIASGDRLRVDGERGTVEVLGG
ncbi:PEP/pyruvate-binding domain-containing protein [Streptomyces sp. NBC_01304]|uniref:PEP/pyruvate-binding domain-containing protein n=1 Tax=Streptomyces sp. NBC_01304 TaxID=2903818 RepID=UPI002E154B18|nr:PEP-utilizing enzyme [Streptomyces sp. NBC_01304]